MALRIQHKKNQIQNPNPETIQQTEPVPTETIHAGFNG
jgi:hypothetical protein